MEVHAQRLVLDRVPADAETEAEAPACEHVDLRRLLGEQCRLALPGDDDAGDELEAACHAGQVAEEHEDLVEHVLGAIRADEVRVAGVVRSQHVVVGEQVVEAELLHGLRELAHALRVGADLGLREDGAELQALDARATDDGVAPVGEANPRLALAVVVGRPHDQRRRLAADRHRLRALRLGAAPHADEHVRLPLVADRRLVGVTRVDAQLVRQRHQHVHHRSLDGLEVSTTDGVLEQRVAGEDHFAVGHERHAVVRVAGRRQRVEAQPTRLDRARDDRAGEPLDELVVSSDMILVTVRGEDVRHGQVVVVDRGEQRLERRARVDEHRRPARLVVGEVRLREPARIHTSQNVHARSLVSDRGAAQWRPLQVPPSPLSD